MQLTNFLFAALRRLAQASTALVFFSSTTSESSSPAAAVGSAAASAGTPLTSSGSGTSVACSLTSAWGGRAALFLARERCFLVAEAGVALKPGITRSFESRIEPLGVVARGGGAALVVMVRVRGVGRWGVVWWGAEVI